MDLNLDLNLIFKRIMRAALLDKEFYKEVEADPTLNQEALMIVVAVSVLSGIGAFFANLGENPVLSLIITSGIGIGNYYVWAYVTHFIGTNLFAGDADTGELLRVLGYASAPLLLGLLAFIPCIGGLIAFVGAIWALVAGFYGVREALDLDTTQTLITVFLGWLAVIIITSIVNRIFGFAGMGQSLSSFRR